MIRVVIRNKLNKTPYELRNGRKLNIGYFKVFGCKCFIVNTKDNLGNFDTKSDEGIFLGYSQISKAYRVFNKRTLIVEESMHVVFDEANPFKRNDDDDVEILKDGLNNIDIKNDSSNLPQPPKEESPPLLEPLKVDRISDLLVDWKIMHNHLIDQILGGPS